MLWSWLLAQGIKINFAHRTFRWSNEARGVAAVHCVIVGFGLDDRSNRVIYEYPDIRGEPQAILARQINPYLVDAPLVLLEKRRAPLAGTESMRYGSKPVDGGYLIFSDKERAQFLAEEPTAKPLFRPYLGAEELINGNPRWCLWLVDVSPTQLRSYPKVLASIDAVKQFRLASRKQPTREAASTPALFAELRQPRTSYLAIPEISSERREYLPIGHLGEGVIASNKLYTVANASLHTFGVLCSKMHFVWMAQTSGRLKSDFQYSASLTYNNFPWPVDATDKQKKIIEAAAQAVLDARAKFPKSSLADLYDPLTMPAALLKAHQVLDRAVDAAYGKKTFGSDAERVAFLFELHQKLTSLLPVEKPVKRKSRRRPSPPDQVRGKL